MTAGVVRQIRALTVAGTGGADYHRQDDGHWIDGRIATPMSKFPAYRERRSSFGLDVLGTVVIEVEDGAGNVGVGVSTGGPPAAWIVERHLSRFVEGASVEDIATTWEQMFLATLFYGRKGLALNAISAVDLALWDLRAKVHGVPVYALIGGLVRSSLQCYATGPRPEVARRLGFVGAKIPLRNSPADGDAGVDEDVERLAAARAAVGYDFPLMWDCWMSLDLPTAVTLARRGADHGLTWIEEPFMPDDYWSLRKLKSALPDGVHLASGEHEATRHGFRLLIEAGCDVIQPDVGWCGGLSELLRIDDLAASAGVAVVPHGSSVSSYHFCVSRPSDHPTEFLMMHPDAASVVPMFTPLLVGEPVPVDGVITLDDTPGFGVTLNPHLDMERPYGH